MACFLKYKNITLILFILLFIPTDFWWILYTSFINNLNFGKAFYSIPLVFIFKYDFKNIYFVNNIDKLFKSNTTEINLFKKSKFLTIQGVRKFESFNVIKFSNNKPELLLEAKKAYNKAVEFKSINRVRKAKKLFVHALKLDPYNADILAEFGELIEVHESNILLAEHFCTKAILSEPTHFKAQECKKRTSPIVEELDQKKLNQIDSKVSLFFKIPENNPELKRLKKEQYFSYIYHTTSIEGNTLSLAQTRFIIESRLAIGGKSLMEQNEVMGVDLALKFLNSLLNEGKDGISLDDILEIHKRILGFVDISEAGVFRHKQVFIADHTPPPSDQIPDLMIQFIDWLNSDEIKELHPIELAALAHWKLVFIHPFSDGNGRTARLLMNLILMKANYPPSIIRTEDREIYFKLIKIANESDVRPFIRFIADCTERTIDDYLSTYSETVNLLPSTGLENNNLTFSIVYST